MKTVYIDESGHTGADMLNTEQPVFSLCAVIPKADTIDKVRRCFPRLQASELKHISLHKRRKDQLIKALGIILEDCMTISFVEPKLYGLIESFLYDCVCPFGGMFDFGSTWYSKLAMILFRFPELFGGNEFLNVLNAYQAAIREPHEALGYLLSTVARLKNDNLFWLTKGLRSRHKEIMKSFTRDPAPSLQVSCLFAIVTQLELQMDSTYKVIYDNASDIDRLRDNFMACCNSGCGRIHVAPGVEVDFPLSKFKGLCAADSKKSKCIQLADLLAGAVQYAGLYVFGKLDNPIDIKYGKQVMELLMQIQDSRFLFKPIITDEDISQDIQSFGQKIRSTEA